MHLANVKYPIRVKFERDTFPCVTLLIEQTNAAVVVLERQKY